MVVYRDMYEHSIKDPKVFWSDMARKHLHWSRPFSDAEAMAGSFEEGNIRWFADGQLNVSYNCIDRHVAAGRGDDVAIIWEADEPGRSVKFTYRQVLAETCRIANVMLAHGVRRGDTVALYMPMMPELAFTMLACTRIGAVHSVVFAGFSAESLRDRILDARSKWVFTANEGRRGGKSIPLKHTTETAVSQSPCVRAVFVFKRTELEVKMGPLDVDMGAEMKLVRPYCPVEAMGAEDLLFLLYTSGCVARDAAAAASAAVAAVLKTACAKGGNGGPGSVDRRACTHVGAVCAAVLR
jgi:acetyl-CoA synthetase